jgi:hypothetical protein
MLFAHNPKIYWVVTSFASYACNAPLLADDKTDPDPGGVIAELTAKNTRAWAGLQDSNWTVGGWGTTGINYNSDDPHDNSNGPISMTDRNGELNLYQLDLFVEKVLAKQQRWEVGGRFDFMFGTDSRYTQASGHWDTKILGSNSYYNIALPQAYLEVFAPIGNGLSAKFGHFYSIIGYESVPSSPNFFASHTYSFKSSPFTTTGALLNFALDEEWNLNFGAVTGPDNFDRDLGAWSQMSGISWTNIEMGTSLSFSILQGDIYQYQPSNQVYYSAIFQQNLGKWHYVLQHDRGTLAHAVNDQTASWYSIVNYLTYQINEIWGVGMRGEWFRDQNGIRYGNGEAGYYDVTAGLNWKPKQWLLLRPEFRYDWSQSQIPPYDAGKRYNQLVMGIDAVIQF